MKRIAGDYRHGRRPSFQEGNFKANLTPREFVSGVMKGLQNDAFEVGYGMTEGLIQASRAELDKSFEQMNSRM